MSTPNRRRKPARKTVRVPKPVQTSARRPERDQRPLALFGWPFHGYDHPGVV